MNLYRYHPINELNLRALESNYLWFSKLDTLNDPYEGKYSLVNDYTYQEIEMFINAMTSAKLKSLADIKNMVDSYFNDKDKLLELITDSINLELQNQFVCCFTKNPLNFLMWSHYTDSHKGMLLEFDTSQDPTLFQFPLPMQYTYQFPICDFIREKVQSVQKIWFSKSEVWSYEDEYRVFKSGKENVKGMEIKYNTLCLKSITFGCNTSPKDIASVKNFLKNMTHIKYNKCCLQNKEYKLQIVPLV